MPLAAPTLHTGRLLLRPFDDTDAPDLLALHTNAHVMRYWDGPAWTERRRAERFIATCREMAAEGSGVAPNRLCSAAHLADRKPPDWCSHSSR